MEKVQDDNERNNSSGDDSGSINNGNEEIDEKSCSFQEEGGDVNNDVVALLDRELQELQQLIHLQQRKVTVLRLLREQYLQGLRSPMHNWPAGLSLGDVLADDVLTGRRTEISYGIERNKGVDQQYSRHHGLDGGHGSVPSYRGGGGMSAGDDGGSFSSWRGVESAGSSNDLDRYMRLRAAVNLGGRGGIGGSGGGGGGDSGNDSGSASPMKTSSNASSKTVTSVKVMSLKFLRQMKRKPGGGAANKWAGRGRGGGGRVDTQNGAYVHVVAVGTADGFVLFYDVTGELLCEYDAGHHDAIIDIVYEGTEAAMMATLSTSGLIRTHAITVYQHGKRVIGRKLMKTASSLGQAEVGTTSSAAGETDGEGVVAATPSFGKFTTEKEGKREGTTNPLVAVNPAELVTSFATGLALAVTWEGEVEQVQVASERTNGAVRGADTIVEPGQGKSISLVAPDDTDDRSRRSSGDRKSEHGDGHNGSDGGGGVHGGGGGGTSSAPPFPLSMHAYYNKATRQAVLLVGDDQGSVTSYLRNGTVIDEYEGANPVRALHKGGQSIAISDGAHVRFLRATKLTLFPTRFCRVPSATEWSDRSFGNKDKHNPSAFSKNFNLNFNSDFGFNLGKTFGAVTALTFDVLAPSYLYVGYESGDVLVFFTRDKEVMTSPTSTSTSTSPSSASQSPIVTGGGGCRLVQHLHPFKESSSGGGGGGGGGDCEVDCGGNGGEGGGGDREEKDNAATTLLAVRGIVMVVNANGRLTVYNTTDVAHEGARFLFEHDVSSGEILANGDGSGGQPHCRPPPLPSNDGSGGDENGTGGGGCGANSGRVLFSLSSIGYSRDDDVFLAMAANPVYCTQAGLSRSDTVGLGVSSVVVIVEAFLPYDPYEVDISWLRLPVLVLGVVLVAFYQIMRRKSGPRRMAQLRRELGSGGSRLSGRVGSGFGESNWQDLQRDLNGLERVASRGGGGGGYSGVGRSTSFRR